MINRSKGLASVLVLAVAALAGCSSAPPADPRGGTPQSGTTRPAAQQPASPAPATASQPGAPATASQPGAPATASQPGAPGKNEPPRSDAPKAPSRKGVSLKIWTQFNDQEMAGLQMMVDEWNAQTGNNARVEPTQGGFQEYAIAAQAGNGPDIYFGMPHDNLGTFWKAGMLQPVPEGVLQESRYVPQTLQAVTYQGKMYGFPMAMEAVGLFYNTSLVKDPPRDWDTFLSIARDKGFMYAVGEPYFNYGFIAGYGGYVFKDTGGGLDVNDIGLNNEGAVKGMQLIADMIHTYKLMPKDVDGEIAKGKFTAGKSAFWLTGSWEINGLRDANVPFSVAPMPTLPGGQTFRPFVGVQTGFVNSESRHQAEVWDLVKFMLSGSRLDEWAINVSHRLPVTKDGLDRPDFKSNAILSAIAVGAANGTPMPNVPEVMILWPAFAQCMTVIANGTLQPRQAADAMVDQLRKAIAQER